MSSSYGLDIVLDTTVTLNDVFYVISDLSKYVTWLCCVDLIVETLFHMCCYHAMTFQVTL